MIVPMKKATIIVQEKDASSAVGILRALGVLHVEYQPAPYNPAGISTGQSPQGKDISAISETIAFLSEAINILSEKGSFLRHSEGGQRPTEESSLRSDSSLRPEPSLGEVEGGFVQNDIYAVLQRNARRVVNLKKRIVQLEEYSRRLKNNIIQWEPWGDFDPEKIKELASHGVYPRLYQVPVKDLDNFPKNVLMRKISVIGGIANCLAISKTREDVSYPEIVLPKMGLAKMRLRLEEVLKTTEALKMRLEQYLSCRKEFLRAKSFLENELEFLRALAAMGKTESLSYLAGYIPQDSADMLSERAKKEKWGLLLADPAPEDNVPTLIRNGRWVSLIKPVFKLLEIIPGYRELDSSTVFFIFFSIFFGILIGDAGYGLVYALITFLCQKKMANTRNKNIFFLFYILSSCAFIWGLLTGTFFGQEWVLKAGFKPLIPALNDIKNMQAFCFFLGALHLSIAHSWRAALKAPSLAMLADIGWICILWSAFFLAKLLILGDALPFFWQGMFVAGISLVIFFTSPQKNILKAFGKGLGALVLSLMNNFTDVVSYIRLFAVGMAGVAIANAFNAMAADIGRGSLVALLGSIFVLVVGHALCIVLGPMSVLVHGVRLNVLEFAGHANISWSGMAYHPLKEEKQGR